MENEPKLTIKEQVFFEHYIETFDARASALKAGYSERTALTNAYMWVRNREWKPNLYDAIHNVLRERRKQHLAEQEFILERLRLIASADPSELSQTRRVNCRYCWGEGHEYQWREREYLAAAEEAEKKGKGMPEWQGGWGFQKWRPPCPECPECDGNGELAEWFADTRTLSPSAAALYAGTKTTKNGIEIMKHSQTEALQLLGRYHGMWIDKKELSGPGGGPIVIPSTITLVAQTEPVDDSSGD